MAATGRKKFVIAGLWTEACVQFPTLDMLKEGYEIYIPADACGDLSIEAHNRSMDRAVQAQRRLGNLVQISVARGVEVGAQIGIYNPSGEKVGTVSRLRNRESLFLVGPDRSLVASIGYPPFYLYTASLSIPALLFLYVLSRRRDFRALA